MQADCSAATLTATNWEGADLTWASFARAKLDLASLAHAVVSQTSFDGADLTGANLHGLDEAAATWKGATLVRVRRTDAALLAAERWMPPPVDAAAGA